MIRKNIAVIGLGNFGKAVVAALLEKKVKVTVFDRDVEKINYFQSFYEQINAVVLDATNSNFLKDSGIVDFDDVILTISSNLEQALLTAAALIELKIENLSARARNSQHAKILKTMGIKQVIFPDKIAAKLLATQTLFDIEFKMQILDDDYGIVQIKVTDNSKAGISLQELNLINNKDFQIIRINRKNKTYSPSEIKILQINDKIYIMAKLTKLSELNNLFC